MSSKLRIHNLQTSMLTVQSWYLHDLYFFPFVFQCLLVQSRRKCRGPFLAYCSCTGNGIRGIWWCEFCSSCAGTQYSLLLLSSLWSLVCISFGTRWISEAFRLMGLDVHLCKIRLGPFLSSTTYNLGSKDFVIDMY